MPNVVVRYQTKPDRADENQQLIEAVFADLERIAEIDLILDPDKLVGLTINQ